MPSGVVAEVLAAFPFVATSTVVPNLQRFPFIGRRYLDQPPQSAEALTLLGKLGSDPARTLREYLHGDYLILYTVATPGHHSRNCSGAGSVTFCASATDANSASTTPIRPMNTVM